MLYNTVITFNSLKLVGSTAALRQVNQESESFEFIFSLEVSQKCRTSLCGLLYLKFVLRGELQAPSYDSTFIRSLCNKDEMCLLVQRLFKKTSQP